MKTEKDYIMVTDENGITYESCDDFRCPCCGSALFISLTGISSVKNPVTVYCGYGPCGCTAMNDGRSGASVEDAMEKLKNAIDEDYTLPEDFTPFWRRTR